MENRGVVFVPTVPHTGTQFLLRFLRQILPEIHQCLAIVTRGPDSSDGQPVGGLPASAILHTHLPEIDPGTGRRVGIHADAVTFLCRTLRSVTTVRDPVAAILTRAHRMPDTDLRIVVDGYRQLATIARYQTVYCLPVDIHRERLEVRYARILALVDHCRLTPFVHDSALRMTAEKWEPENTTGEENPFRPAYDARDWGRILELFGGEYHPALTYLSACLPTLLPFLHSVGYRDSDLMLPRW